MSTQNVKIKGIPADLGGRQWIVPPISAGALESMRERLDAFAGDISDPKQFSTAIDLVHVAMRRNYPDLTREHLADELLDVENLLDVVGMALDVGGLRRKALGQPASPIENR